MLRVFWAQSSSRISATKPILVASEWNINVWMALQTLVNTFEHTLFWFLSSSPPPLIKRKAHISAFQPVHFLSCELHRPAREHNTNIFFSFPLLQHGASSLSHITQYFMLPPLPSLSSRIKWYCLYTPSIYHPISHFPWLVYLPWVLGRHEGTLASSSFPLSSPPSLPSFPLFSPCNQCWLLVAIDIWGLIKPWRPCLIYAGGVWVVPWKCSKKTQVIYSGTCCLILPGLVKILLEAASSSNCSISRFFTFCTRFVLRNKCLQVNKC